MATWEIHLLLTLQVVNETTMTEIEVSIYILSWWNYTYDE